MTRHQQKQTITAIQQATGRDRKTIRKVVTEAEHGHDLVRRARESKLDPYKQYIEERWQQGCQNAVVLWEEVRAQGYTGSLSLIKQLVQPLRPQRGIEPVQRYETDPGVQAQCDWADFGAPLYIFIYTMSFSAACMWNLCTTNAKPPCFAVSSTPLRISAVCPRRFCRII